MNLADYLKDKKSKVNNEREVMVSELSIDISRYRAFLDDSSIEPNYLQSDFIRDFVILPTQFYQPGAPQKFQEFLETWGTHVVKSVDIGAKFKMQRTMENDKSVSVDELKQSTQSKLE